MTSVPEILKSVAGDEEKGIKSDPGFIQSGNCFVAGFISLMFIFAMGMTIGYSAPATVDMKMPGSRFRDITFQEISWIGSLNMLGGIQANLLAGFFTHKFGRKAVLMIFSPLFLLSWLMITYSSTMRWLYAGRIISGFCTGLYCVACPAYLAEIAPKEIRGLFTSLFPLTNNFGILFAMGLGLFLRWSWLAMSIAVCIACATCLMFFMPESPAWLINESRIGEAGRTLRFLRGKKWDVKKEIEATIKNSSEHKNKGITLKDFKDPILYKPIGITFLLILFHGAAGSVPLNAFMVEIFEEVDSAVPCGIAATVLTGVQFMSSVFCGSIIDKFGRRKLYITSGIGTCINLTVFGAYTLIIKCYPVNKAIFGYVPLISLAMYSFFYIFGVGNLPFVIIPELVPIRFRSALLSLATFFLSIFAFILTKIFHNMKTLLGLYGVYWTYASFTFISVLFGYFFLPETRNLTFEEINKKFAKKQLKS